MTSKRACLNIFVATMLGLGLGFVGGASGADVGLAELPSPQSSNWLERETLSGDWGGGRTWLQERGIILKPRVTLFNQGLTSGDGDHGFEFGGKADVLLNSNLTKLGFWDGLGLTVHAEYNFGKSVNGRGGTLIPVNTALLFPGLQGSDVFDFTSVFASQKLGDRASLMLGKINMMDIAAGRPFMGGAGIDAFQNIAFTGPPSGIVPPYIFGGILGIRTEPANYTLMVYDPNSAVNRSGWNQPFAGGVTVRGSVEVPVVIAGRSGHQGFAAAYSNKNGADLADAGDIILPPIAGPLVGTKSYRYYYSIRSTSICTSRLWIQCKDSGCLVRLPHPMAIRIRWTGRCSWAWAALA